MSEFLKKIILPQIKFEGQDEGEKFVRFYLDLYRIEILKDGLDLILTKLQEQDLTIEIKLIKGWDTTEGCYVTEQSKIFNQVLGKFSNKINKKIILRSFAHNVLIHEMAHAMEFESGVDLNAEFRKCIGLDMKDRVSPIITLQAEIQRLMIDQLKSYSAEKFIGELFTRFFELIAMSREVRGGGPFSLNDVLDHFANVNNFLVKIFNPQIRKLIDTTIAKETAKIAADIRQTEPEKRFADDIKSFHHKTKTKNWSGNVKSNAMWQKGWQKYEELEEQKKKEIEDKKDN